MKYLILIIFAATLGMTGCRPYGTAPQPRPYRQAAMLNHVPQNCITATPTSCPFIMAGHY